jgi:hypothetical protein
MIVVVAVFEGVEGGLLVLFCWEHGKDGAASRSGCEGS